LILAAGKGVSIGATPSCRTASPPSVAAALHRADAGLLEAWACAHRHHVGFRAPRFAHIAVAGVSRRPAARDVLRERRLAGPNGLSVLAARSFVTGRTLLVMADQIAAPALVREIASQPAAATAACWASIAICRACSTSTTPPR
jgi:hypothetical protein